jgi:proton-coupled amino acid transporter
VSLVNFQWSFQEWSFPSYVSPTLRPPHRTTNPTPRNAPGLFGIAGVLSYLTFGPDIQPIVLLNLDLTSRTLQLVQLLYTSAILLSVPITLFPAIRIMEHGLFSRAQSGKASARFKWLKNAFRAGVVVVCGDQLGRGEGFGQVCRVCGVFRLVSSVVLGDDIHGFLMFFFLYSVPLCYIYPAMLHYKACAHTRKQQFIDGTLIVFGFLLLFYTTEQTISVWLPFSHRDKPLLILESS